LRSPRPHGAVVGRCGAAAVCAYVIHKYMWTPYTPPSTERRTVGEEGVSSKLDEESRWALPSRGTIIETF
jgi:hypothetical protein